MRLIPKIMPLTDEQRRANLERTLLRREAKIGGQLFGALPKDHDRQFFCLDENTWIWHEEWILNGKRQVITTRYDVRANGVIKSQDGRPSQYVAGEEARNLYRAVEIYQQRVDAEYQSMLRAA